MNIRGGLSLEDIARPWQPAGVVIVLYVLLSRSVNDAWAIGLEEREDRRGR